jgi:hypothetical protein
MEPLVDRMARVVAEHPEPALPLGELARLVRGSGVAVGSDALLRALAGAPDRFRLIDLWRGPWSGLRWEKEALAHRRGRSAPGGPRGSRRRRFPLPGASGSDPKGGAMSGLPGVARRWVVARPGGADRGVDPPALRRLRQSVSHLGWNVDGRSACDTARWCRLLLEARRVRERSSQ